MRPGNSFHFGITPVGLDIDLDRKRKFGFSTGLRYTVDNYRLSNNSITLGREDGRIVPVALDEPAGKSKLRITSLGFPLQFSYEPVRHLNIAVVGYCDFTVGVNSIYKKPKVKNGLSGVNPFRFGIGGAVSYRGFGVYVRYGITPAFQEQCRADLSPAVVRCLYLHVNGGVYETDRIVVAGVAADAGAGAECLLEVFRPLYEGRRVHQRAVGAEDDADDEPAGRRKKGDEGLAGLLAGIQYIRIVALDKGDGGQFVADAEALATAPDNRFHLVMSETEGGQTTKFYLREAEFYYYSEPDADLRHEARPSR